jgi:carbapenam-3-carboxylate synthase
VLYSESELSSAGTDEKFVWIIGNITNIEPLKDHFPFLQSFVPCSTASFILSLIDYLGVTAALNLLEGTYYIIIRESDKLSVFGDILGQMPLYYTKTPSIFITSSIKLLAQMSHFKPTLKPFEDFQEEKRNPDYSPFTNLNKLKPDDFLVLSRFSVECVKKPATNYLGLFLPNEGTNFVHLLDQQVKHLSHHDLPIGVPLSGGIDSSTICALLKKNQKELYTYSIGTEDRNEFEFSTAVANHLKCVNKKKLITENDVNPLMQNLIEFNEMFDALAIEILLPFEMIYQMAVADGVKNLATGYGSDLILGGTLFNKPLNTLHYESVKLIQRTYWTNEFVNTNAQRYDVSVVHPFWNPGLIKYGLNILPHLKMKNGIEKYIFRKIVDEANLLPDSIVWRKKIGIHEGSGLNGLIKRALNTNRQSEIDLYIYETYRAVILKQEVML